MHFEMQTGLRLFAGETVASRMSGAHRAPVLLAYYSAGAEPVRPAAA